VRIEKVTMADVAREAGVSAATISRLVRGGARVNAETRDRILMAAQRLNFNLEARKSSRIIAFLLSNRGVLHPFHSSILMGAEAFCAEHDYGLLFLPLQYSLTLAKDRLSLPEILLRKTVVAGAIVAGTNSQAMLELLTDHEIPWVCLGNNVVGDWPHDRTRSIFFDDIRGAYELTTYLISLGHIHIGFAGNLSLPWYFRRFQGYRKAIEEAGLKVMSSDLRTLDGEEMGYLGARLMLQKDPRPTAIFAADDPAGRGVYWAARDQDLKVPEDLTVAGFNDTPDAAALHPPLTTVRVFTEELGRQAGGLLFQQIGQPDVATPSVVLPTQLIRRESSASPSHPAVTARKSTARKRSAESRK
jgi:DNA-binding LacI/PurR family transcriptional regulator